MAADGLSWDCRQDGMLEERADLPPARTPALQPDDRDNLAEPAIQPPPAPPAAAQTPPAAPATMAEPASRPREAPPAAPMTRAAQPVPAPVQTIAPPPAAGPNGGVAESGKANPDVAAAPASPAAPPAASTAPDTLEGIDPRLDAGLNWQQCRRTPVDFNLAVPDTLEDPDLPVIISADSFEASELDNIAALSGGVELQQGSQQLFAEQVRYARGTGEVDATGRVLLQRPDLRIAATQVRYNLQNRQGSAQGAAYRLPGIMARGTAQQVEFIDPDHSRYQDITYTTCGPDSSDWLLSAAALEIDLATGLGTAHDAKLTLLGAPVAWLPKLTFPIDDRRRSGLLIPSVGYSEKLGFDLSLPYYFNLAPNYDLTLRPRIMSQRGVMLGGEFRFLTDTTEGVIDGNWLPSDAESDDDHRGSLSVQTRGQHNRHLSSAIRFNQVTDNEFLKDFGGSLDVTSRSLLERAGEVRYDTQAWSALARLQSYQNVDDNLSKADRPYDRLPQFLFNLEQDARSLPLTYELQGEFVQFAKSGDFVEGTRIDLQPGISLPLREAHYHLIPRASLRYTTYDLDDQAPGLNDSPDRLAPIFSLDGGLYYDRQTSWFGEAASQTLEPRMFYLLVPKEDQKDIPIFDTTEYDFSFDNLFRENRFNGADRLGDANQLTLALTSRINSDQTGRELLRTSLGGIVYFRDREVQLPGDPDGTDSTSSLTGEVAADLGSGWRARGGLMWNPHDDTIEQALAQASYRDRDDNILNLAYRLRDGVSTHTDLGTVWRINPNTRMIARWHYSLSEKRNEEALAGIEYGRCCWRVRALLRQQVDGDDDEQNLSFLVQLELNGLGSLGDNIDSLLDDGIYGYRREND